MCVGVCMVMCKRLGVQDALLSGRLRAGSVWHVAVSECLMLGGNAKCDRQFHPGRGVGVNVRSRRRRA